MRFLIYIFILAISLFLMTLYDMYGAFLLAVVMILVPLLSILTGWWGRRHVSLSSPAAFSAIQGEATDIPLTAAGKALPFLASLSADARKETASCGETKNGVRILLPITAEHVGRMSLPTPRLSWTDPFGFFHFHKKGTPLSVLVLPKRMGHPEKTWQTLAHLMSSEEMEHFGATLYTPGDNPRLINWKVTARKDDLYVRDSYPADATRLALACDYDLREDARDLLCDALYSAGLALLSHHEPFRFVWADTKGRSVVSPIRGRGEWEDAVKSFLSHGGEGALEGASLPPDMAILYLTGNPTPRVAPTLHPVIWCAEDSPRAALSGKAAISAAMGGAQ